MRPPRLFTATVISLFFVIVLVPICYMIAAPFGAGSLETLTDYLIVIEKRQLSLAQNTLLIGSGTTFLCLLVGIPLAFLIQRTDLWGRRLFGLLYIIPILIPPYIHAIVGTHLDAFFEHFLGLDMHSVLGVIFVLTLAYYPFVTLTTLTGLRSIDRNLEEASLLCHGMLRTLRRITLPLVTPHVLAGATFVFVFCVADFGVADILRVKVYPFEIFIQYSAFYNERAATILSLPLVALTLYLIIFQKRFMRDRSYIQITAGEGKRLVYLLGRLNAPAFVFCIILLGFSAGLPISVLFKTAGQLSNYFRILDTSGKQIGYSLLLAGSGALLAVLLGFALAYVIEKTSVMGRTLLSYCSFIPLAIPATMMGIGFIKVWNRPVVDLVYASSWIIVFSYIARFIPFSVIIITSGLKQVSQRLEEAASLSTPQWKRVMGKITLPLTKSSLIAAFFIVFILSFGELGTTLLVIPPGRETIPIKIYNLMHYGAEKMVAALCLILLVIILAFSAIFLIFLKWLRRREGEAYFSR